MMVHLQHKLHGINIIWDRKQRFHQCACHILNLVAKDFLLYMGQLANEDNDFFYDYLLTDKVTLEDSDNKATPSVQDVQASIKSIKKTLGQVQKKLCSQRLNQATLETQDKSSDLAIIRGDKSNNPGDCEIHKLAL
ncbi:hypothetical protein O181_058753 [Austropuccinia psidii MF-1]|uniref:Uncharacterized protein n=1 Tax=Austropuccinia psidii MF-1 TaxID=1389203 RepID=A0A9Q3HVV4_9BASI|nr:hypothetical protein [Austropuccinia psidii MF-1]